MNRPGRTPADTAQIALLLEVSGTPKPGNVDRRRDLSELRFEHFLAGAVGSRRGLERAQEGAPVGEAFETAVAGMASQRGGNTQFGALLLCVPLVRASAEAREAGDDVTPSIVERVVEATSVADAANFYRAFEHVDVFVAEPPEDLEALDVRRGADAIAALEVRELTLFDVMERSVPGDDVAREWVTGFERSFEAAKRLEATDEGRPLSDRIAATFLASLADRPDTLVASKHGADVAREVTDRASKLVDDGALWEDPTPAEAFADELVDRGINPGTTADVVAAGIFLALERGGIDV